MAVGIFYLTTIDETLSKEKIQEFSNETEAFLGTFFGKNKIKRTQ